MSQVSVERIIGKLATDEEFRARFAADRAGAVAAFVESGHALTQAEIAALLATDLRCCEVFAEGIDPRLQKASLKDALCPLGRGRERRRP